MTMRHDHMGSLLHVWHAPVYLYYEDAPVNDMNMATETVKAHVALRFYLIHYEGRNKHDAQTNGRGVPNVFALW
jgi:hypothetical protein